MDTYSISGGVHEEKDSEATGIGSTAASRR